MLRGMRVVGTAYPVTTGAMRGPGTTGAFTPLQVTGLRAWYDFSDRTSLFTDAGVTNVSADGQLIYQANDKSGNGQHLTQATEASRPAWTLNKQNGRAAATFNGSSTELTKTGTIAGLSQEDTTVYAVSLSTLAANSQTVIGVRAGTPSILNLSHHAAQLATFYRDDAALAGGNTYNATLTEPNVVSATHAAGGVATIYENGTQRNQNTVNLGTTTQTSMNTSVGGNPHDALGWFQGSIMEVLVFAGAHALPDRKTIEYGLGIKWGIAVA